MIVEMRRGAPQAEVDAVVERARTPGCDVQLNVGTGKVVIAGPCSSESLGQLRATAQHVTELGAAVVRGSAFKLCTSPFSFQGMGEGGCVCCARCETRSACPW